MKTVVKTVRLLWIMIVMVSTVGAQEGPGSGNTKDIRKLSQQFIDPNDHSPWIFVPQDNVKSVSLKAHRGFATIQHGEGGKDIKGILKDPIRIDDYPMPWEFHLALGRGTQTSP